MTLVISQGEMVLLQEFRTLFTYASILHIMQKPRWRPEGEQREASFSVEQNTHSDGKARGELEVLRIFSLSRSQGPNKPGTFECVRDAKLTEVDCAISKES